MTGFAVIFAYVSAARHRGSIEATPQSGPKPSNTAVPSAFAILNSAIFFSALEAIKRSRPCDLQYLSIDLTKPGPYLPHQSNTQPEGRLAACDKCSGPALPSSQHTLSANNTTCRCARYGSKARGYVGTSEVDHFKFATSLNLRSLRPSASACTCEPVV